MSKNAEEVKFNLKMEIKVATQNIFSIIIMIYTNDFKVWNQFPIHVFKWHLPKSNHSKGASHFFQRGTHRQSKI